MASLHNVIQKYTGIYKPISASLGSDQNQQEIVQITPTKGNLILDRKALKQDLEKVKKDNQIYFNICVVLVTVLFSSSIGVVLFNLNNPVLIKLTMGAFGISAAALISVMINLWRLKSNTELLLALVANMDAETVKTIIEILVKKL